MLNMLKGYNTCAQNMDTKCVYNFCMSLFVYCFLFSLCAYNLFYVHFLYTISVNNAKI
jgi:hypothetical protein